MEELEKLEKSWNKIKEEHRFVERAESIS